MKKFLTLVATLYAAASFAALDVNQATEAQLDGIRGIGPGLSSRILDERQRHGAFQDWADLIRRVPGVGAKSAARLSAEGVTVNGEAFGTPPASATKN
ncbi:MAG: helix-hairpin-helix domain-containing protein [Acidovorax sp.]|uniref:ComEA family DNA-binding protein n=1 Tax=Acidovorax sp. TaxID=1872122 RepID=UPI0039E30F37